MFNSESEYQDAINAEAENDLFVRPQDPARKFHEPIFHEIWHHNKHGDVVFMPDSKWKSIKTGLVLDDVIPNVNASPRWNAVGE